MKPEVWIETKRLTLRPFNLNDALDVFHFASDEQVALPAGWKVHRCLSDSTDVIWNVLSGENEWAIVLKEENKVIGSISLSADLFDLNSEVKMIGFLIAREYWKKGYAFEAATAVVSYGIETLRIQRIRAYHFPHNSGSETLLRKLGFQYYENLLTAFETYDGKLLDLFAYEKGNKTNH